MRAVLEEIVNRFSGSEFTASASAALRSLPAAETGKQSAKPPARRMTGDLEVFGLPNLCQTLSESQMSGDLVLEDPSGQTIATLVFADGKVLDCRTGTLHGEDAFYQLFEKPSPGNFVFKGHDAPAALPESDTPPFEVMGAMLEALRRYDEFEQARTLVPDDVSLRSADTKPTLVEDEPDRTLVKTVWQRAADGETPASCEATIPADSYRIRRLYSHWLEMGALQPA